MDNAILTNPTQSRDATGLLTGFLVGGLIGYGAMMLFAPQAGKITRSQIEQKGAALQGQASDIFDELAELSHFDSRKILAGSHAPPDRQKSQE